MKDWIPLLQTILWVAPIGYILWRYHAQLDSIFTALNKRISSGSGVKVGVLGMTVDVEAQSAQQQLEKIQEEVGQIDPQQEAANTPGPHPVGAPTPEKRLASEAFVAEDLALREMAEVFSTAITRQVRIGSDVFDGFFKYDGIPYFFEVKIANRVFNTFRLRHYLEGLDKTLFAQMYGIDAKLTYIVVYRDKEADLIIEQKRLSKAASKWKSNVTVRCYHLTQLEEKWRTFKVWQ